MTTLNPTVVVAPSSEPAFLPEIILSPTLEASKSPITRPTGNDGDGEGGNNSALESVSKEEDVASDEMVLIAVLIAALGAMLVCVALGIVAVVLHHRQTRLQDSDSARSDAPAIREPSLSPDAPPEGPPASEQAPNAFIVLEEVSTLGDTYASSASYNWQAAVDEQTLQSGVYTTIVPRSTEEVYSV